VLFVLCEAVVSCEVRVVSKIEKWRHGPRSYSMCVVLLVSQLSCLLLDVAADCG
jgi:hypothetical protein